MIMSHYVNTTFLFFTLFLVSLDHFKSPVVTVPRGFSSFTTSVHDRKAFSGVTNWQLGPYISGYRFIQCSSIQWLTNWMLLTFQFSNRKYEPSDIQYKHIYRNDTIELCTSTLFGRTNFLLSDYNFVIFHIYVNFTLLLHIAVRFSLLTHALTYIQH